MNVVSCRATSGAGKVLIIADVAIATFASGDAELEDSLIGLQAFEALKERDISRGNGKLSWDRKIWRRSGVKCQAIAR